MQIIKTCCSFAQSCPTLCDPMDWSTPGCPVLHCLPEFAQMHVHWCHLTVSTSVACFSFCLQSFPASGTFPMNHLFASDDQNTGASASSSVLPVSIQGWSPLRLIGLVSLLSKGSQESSPAPQFESINSLAFCLLYGPTLTTVCDHWEDHSLDYIDLCWESNVSAF